MLSRPRFRKASHQSWHLANELTTCATIAKVAIPPESLSSLWWAQFTKPGAERHFARSTKLPVNKHSKYAGISGKQTGSRACMARTKGLGRCLFWQRMHAVWQRMHDCCRNACVSEQRVAHNACMSQKPGPFLLSLCEPPPACPQAYSFAPNKHTS